MFKELQSSIEYMDDKNKAEARSVLIRIAVNLSSQNDKEKRREKAV